MTAAVVVAETTAPRRRLTLSMVKLTPEELAIGALLYPERDYWRPQTRADCANVPRPCPFVSCRHHLALDINPNGAIKINFPDREVWEAEHSCSLDVADAGCQTLEEVGAALGNVSRERARQIETRAVAKLKAGLTGRRNDTW